MNREIGSFFVATLLVAYVGLALAAPTVGAAPKGDATTVASRIIKYNFPTCKRVAAATRASDGAIRANCDGTSYLVFTLFDSKEGKLHEVAMNCTAAKKLLEVAC